MKNPYVKSVHTSKPERDVESIEWRPLPTTIRELRIRPVKTKSIFTESSRIYLQK